MVSKHRYQSFILNYSKEIAENRLKGWKAKKKSKIMEMQKKSRIASAKEHFNWTCEDWSKVLFSDESTFTFKVMWEIIICSKDLMKHLAVNAYCIL